MQSHKEGMLETLVEIYTDAFYEVKDEYLEKLGSSRKIVTQKVIEG